MLIITAGTVVGCTGEPDAPIEITQCDLDEDCGEGEVCDEATGSCEPEEQESNDSSENGGTPGCSEVMESCDPLQRDRDDFWCLDRDDDGDGVCIEKCGQTGRHYGCSEGTYCTAVVESGRGGCVSSECDDDADCEGGSCLRLAPGFGTCVDDGAGEEGDSCSGGLFGGDCNEGLVCLENYDGVQQCKEICDPFERWSCGDWSGQACRLIEGSFGVCTNYSEGGNGEAGDLCHNDYAWCAAGMQCRPSDAGPYCMQYCRPGFDDCSSIDVETVCDDYQVIGSDTGICVSPCSSDDGCFDGWECVDETCRKPCTDASFDCCTEENPNCGAVCTAEGYCN